MLLCVTPVKVARIGFSRSLVVSAFWHDVVFFIYH